MRPGNFLALNKEAVMLSEGRSELHADGLGGVELHCILLGKLRTALERLFHGKERGRDEGHVISKRKSTDKRIVDGTSNAKSGEAQKELVEINGEEQR